MALAFDIRMLKTLLRGLAAMDGVVPFQTTTPHVASGVVAPYADRYVDSVRNETVHANAWRQGNAAMWAGTVRMAMMIPAGLVDFFGPIAEESLGEAAVRMAQETANGVFALPTRLANIMVGSASEGAPFDQTLAQTEWALSAAPYIYGAKSMMGRRPLPPVRVSVTRSAIADGGAPNGFGADLLLRVSDEEVAAALEKHGGYRAKAATELGIAPNTISTRVTGASKESPLAKFKTIKGKGGKLIVTDEQMIAALERHHGNRAKAAKDLGIRPSAVDHRVWNAASDSPLFKYNVEKTKQGGRQWVKVCDADLLAALERHQGNRSRAGQEVGLDVNAVSSRIKLAAADSPFAKFKTLKGKADSKKGQGRKASDLQLLQALRRHRGNKMRAARELKISSSAISLRIKQAAAGTPLAKYKNNKMKVQRKAPPHISNLQLLEALKKYDGNRTEVAKELGLAISAVSRRVAQAAPESPLAAFKELKGRRGPRPNPLKSPRRARKAEVQPKDKQGAVIQEPVKIPIPHLDDAAITKALLDNRRDTFKAALQLKCSTGAIAARIALAAEDSPLAAFKNRRR